MPCSTHALSAASIPVQPSQLPKALRAPSGVARHEDSVIVTRVRVSPSSGSNSKVVVVVPRSPVVCSPSHSMTMRRGGSAATTRTGKTPGRSEEHTSELQSRGHLVCRLLLEKKKKQNTVKHYTQIHHYAPW